MDAGGGSEDLSVSADGVALHVHRRVADGGLPAFEYVVASSRSSPVDLLVSQPLPSALDRDAIGFAADASDNWSIRDGEWLTFQCRLDAGDRVSTAWGVRSSSHPPLEAPTLTVTDVDAGHPRAADTEATPVPPDPTEGMAQVEDEQAAPTAGEDIAPEAIPEDGDAPSQREAPSAAPEDSVVASLLQELEAGDVPDRDRRALRDALTADDPASPDVIVEQIQELQRHHNQLTEAIELLEDRVESVRSGAPTTTEINRLKRCIATLHDESVQQTELERLEEQVAALDERAVDVDAIRDIRGALAQLEQDAAADTQAEIEALDASLDDLEERAATVEQLEAVHDEIDAVAEQVSALEAETPEAGAVEAVESEIDELASAQAQLETAVADLDERTPPREDIESLERTVQELEGRIADLAERAAAADALESVNERLKQVEQGVLGYETLMERVADLEDETETRLAETEATLAELEAAVEEHAGEDEVETADAQAGSETGTADTATETGAANTATEGEDGRRIELPIAPTTGLLALGAVGIAGGLLLATASLPAGAAVGSGGVGALLARTRVDDA